MATETLVQIPNDAISISCWANNFVKSMYPSILPPAMSKYQSGLVSLILVSQPAEEK